MVKGPSALYHKSFKQNTYNLKSTNGKKENRLNAFCRKCGEELSEDSSFCTNCGTNQQVANAQTQPNTIVPPKAPSLY